VGHKLWIVHAGGSGGRRRRRRRGSDGIAAGTVAVADHGDDDTVNHDDDDNGNDDYDDYIHDDGAVVKFVPYGPETAWTDSFWGRGDCFVTAKTASDTQLRGSFATCAGFAMKNK